MEFYWGKAYRGLKILLEKPFRLFFCIAGLCLLLGFAQLHTAYDTKNYIESIGQICNVTSKNIMRNGSHTTLYEYDLIWSFEGESYRKHYKDEENVREEGDCRIWIRPDNRNVMLASSGDLRKTGFKYLLFSAASGILGLVLWLIHISGRRESPEERMERLENTKIYSVVMFIFCMIGIGIASVDLYRDIRKGVYRSTVMIDIIIFCAVIAIGCVVVFIAAKKKTRK